MPVAAGELLSASRIAIRSSALNGTPLDDPATSSRREPRDHDTESLAVPTVTPTVTGKVSSSFDFATTWMLAPPPDDAVTEDVLPSLACTFTADPAGPWLTLTFAVRPTFSAVGARTSGT